ncbi:hypothetical protein Z045_02110 [Rhodococcus pyridinivorans KG-16]|uniref:Uncharacterized protein n=1 Tax=Rhodococcus pyridinivorans KG-16 TaxID=1441730 RepID=A0A0V9UQJ5_9NOCA|nr:hypothetical protein Z045_02110 [Rhodococcus pyridinivorans KG-16]
MTRGGHEVVEGQAFPLQVLQVGFAVPDDHDGDPVSDSAHPRGASVDRRESQGQHGEHSDGEDSARHGHVVLRDPLLHEITHGHEQHELEGAQFADTRPADESSDSPQEQEEDQRADHDLHQGTSQASK